MHFSDAPLFSIHRVTSSSRTRHSFRAASAPLRVARHSSSSRTPVLAAYVILPEGPAKPINHASAVYVSSNPTSVPVVTWQADPNISSSFCTTCTTNHRTASSRFLFSRDHCYFSSTLITMHSIHPFLKLPLFLHFLVTCAVSS